MPESLVEKLDREFIRDNPWALNPNASKEERLLYSYKLYSGEPWDSLPISYLEALYPDLVSFGSQFESIREITSYFKDLFIFQTFEPSYVDPLHRFISNYKRDGDARASSGAARTLEALGSWTSTTATIAFREEGTQWEEKFLGRYFIQAVQRTTLGRIEFTLLDGIWTVCSALAMTPFLGQEFIAGNFKYVLTEEQQEQLLQPYLRLREELHDAGFIQGNGWKQN